MGRRKKNKHPLLENIQISGIAAEGKAIAKVDDKVLFVPFAAPGDVADIQVTRSRRKFMEGRVVRFHRLSGEREEPFCSHFGTCGGCKWQHIPYKTQLSFKQQQVSDSLQRIGGIDLQGVEVLQIAASERTRFYRNKLEFTFSNSRWFTSEEILSGEKLHDKEALGFHIPGLFDKVLDIEKCWLQDDPSNEIRLAVKNFALREGLEFFDLKKNYGFLRNLIVRNTPSGQVMVVLVFGSRCDDGIGKLISFIEKTFPDLHSLSYIINEKQNSNISDLEFVVCKGKEYIEEKMEDLVFRVGPKSFYQTNSRQAGELYSIARDFAGLQGHECVYDLYTGAGTIACFIAGDAARVVGIEYVEEAVDNARLNAEINGIDNVSFIAGDMSEVFDDILMDKMGYPHVIITDPPRAGMHPKVISRLLASGADRIVYISCNPATQARDIERLGSRYKVSSTRAVDMFPHTHHVENVVLLEAIL